ncbi:MAG: Bcr/CflA family drug resistance efflux transporter, partial [Paracoccaceae bacterium]
PHLAGSAAGLGGALLIGGGAGVAALAGLILTVANAHYALMGIMCLCSALSIIPALLAERRNRALGV